MSLPALGSACPPPPGLPGEDWVYSLQVPCDPRAPGIARNTLRTVLRQYGLSELVDTAQLLTSELVTNAVRHSTCPVLLLVKRRANALRICVWDSDPEVPGIVCPSPHETYGRGLFLLRRLADDWGCYVLAAGGTGGKVIWFECVPAP